MRAFEGDPHSEPRRRDESRRMIEPPM
jgi:hypothetical protein